MQTKNIVSKRGLLWIGMILGGLVVVFITYMSLMNARMNEVPANLNYATTRLSDKNLFSASYSTSTSTIPVNQMHQWTLHVTSADGQPVENATIAVDGDMPQHGHGLPTKPRVTRYLGNGDYLVEGMKFQMAGWWVMDFTITANGQTDAVHFNMQLH